MCRCYLSVKPVRGKISPVMFPRLVLAGASLVSSSRWRAPGSLRTSPRTTTAAVPPSPDQPRLKSPSLLHALTKPFCRKSEAQPSDADPPLVASSSTTRRRLRPPLETVEVSLPPSRSIPISKYQPAASTHSFFFARLSSNYSCKLSLSPSSYPSVDF